MKSEFSRRGELLLFFAILATLSVALDALIIARGELSAGPVVLVMWSPGVAAIVAVLHAAHNLVIQAFLDNMTIDTGMTRYFTTEFGVGMAVAYAVAAWLCWRAVPRPLAGFERGGRPVR
jgi:hypothetical protein